MVRRPLALAMVAVMILSALMVGCRRSAVPPIEELEEEAEATAVMQELQESGGETETPEQIEEITATPEAPTPEATDEVAGETEPEPAVTAPPVEAPAETEAPAPTDAPEPVIVSGATTYVVQPGDNLFRIALRHNLSTQALAQANNITNPSIISVGQTLTIPASDGSGPVQPPPLPAGCANIYVVRPGDNLFRIALRHNYSQYYLAQYNNIPNPSVVTVGQQICIP